MTPEQYRAAIAKWGYTQQGFAVLVNSGAKSGQYWARVSVPDWVVTVLDLIERRPEVRFVLEEMADEAGREWRTKSAGRPRR